MLLEMSRNAAGRAGNETIHIVNIEMGMRIGTDPRLSEVNEKINPFGLVAHNSGSISMILGVGKYQTEIFQTRAEEGSEGNGYDWGSLAAVFLEEKMPHLVDFIRFDPEAVLSFAIAFKVACEDDSLMKDLFSRAVLD
jgi:hypothetical protein